MILTRSLTVARLNGRRGPYGKRVATMKPNRQYRRFWLGPVFVQLRVR